MQPKLPDQEKIAQQTDRRRRRLLYSLNDIQQALSACAFLYDLDESEKYSKVDLRRFRCFETTLVVSYARPFTQSRGEPSPLTMKMVDLKLSPESKALHDRLMNMRNQIMAHSDSEMMRMTVQAFDIPFDDGTPSINLFQAVFDEGITLHGPLLVETNALLHQVYGAVFRSLYKDAQTNPELFNLRIDSEEARAARDIRM
jgi:hypothetical protein